jgi:hypothetical protein
MVWCAVSCYEGWFVWCVCAASSLNISSGAFKLQTVNMIVLLYSTVQYSTVRYSAGRYSTVEYIAMQYITSQVHSTTVRYSTVRYQRPAPPPI